MKQFIYFFRHKGINAIKIGRTSGESVNDRFNTMKTYSPYGCEIVGYFECDDCVSMERILHERFKGQRLQGEWFDISVDVALSVIETHDSPQRKIKSLFNEWVLNPENDIQALYGLMKQSSILRDSVSKWEEASLIKHHISRSDSFEMTCSTVHEKLCELYMKDFSLKKIGMELVKNGFEAKVINRGGKAQRLYKIKFIDIEHVTVTEKCNQT